MRHALRCTIDIGDARVPVIYLSWVCYGFAIHDHLFGGSCPRSGSSKVDRSTLQHKILTATSYIESNPVTLSFGNTDTPYTPLDPIQREIRLLELAPRNYDDDLVVVLHVESLNYELLGYLALLYAWGQDLSSRKALVDGWNTNVGISLDCALHHIRRNLAESMSMWVDALCLNQYDLEERNAQVLLMNDIYFITLGPEHSGGTNAIACIQDVEVTQSEEIRLLLACVESICQRPWVGRVWVEELVVSQRDPTVYLGIMTLFWSQFYEHIVCLERRNPSSLNVMRRSFLSCKPPIK